VGRRKEEMQGLGTAKIRKMDMWKRVEPQEFRIEIVFFVLCLVLIEKADTDIQEK
jgi:hypothetical protein